MGNSREKTPEKDRRAAMRLPKGLKKLSDAVDQKLGEESDNLAKVLVDKAKLSDPAYMEFVRELAEIGAKPKRKRGVRKLGLSIAERWAMEPEWPGEKTAG